MKSVAAILGLALAISMTSGHADEACRGSDAKYYTEALAYQLASHGIAYRLKSNLVCVASRDASELLAAQGRVHASFYQVAHKVRDSCEEQALVAWAEKEGLRFSVRETMDAQYQPSGRMFLIHAFTPEEVTANAAKLKSEAPKGATCQAGK
jgi:hypothetical protein